MKRILFKLSILGVTAITPCFGASTALQTITMSVASASNITTTGNPGTLAITLNPDGTGSSTDNSTSYTVTSNSGAKGSLKVTGSISSGGDMPTNCSLALSLASNEGKSQGSQTLSSSSVDLVTSLPTLLTDTAAITYTFSVINGWTIPAQSLSRTVTLTLTSAS